jgi:hypothetical protein
MPGNPHQMVRIVASDLDQWLRRRDDLDQPAVVEHQCIAAAQRHRAFQVEQELKPARARHRHSPPVAIVEAENDGIGWRVGPAVLRANLARADHVKMLINFLTSGLRPSPA